MVLFYRFCWALSGILAQPKLVHLMVSNLVPPDSFSWYYFQLDLYHFSFSLTGNNRISVLFPVTSLILMVFATVLGIIGNMQSNAKTLLAAVGYIVGGKVKSFQANFKRHKVIYGRPLSVYTRGSNGAEGCEGCSPLWTENFNPKRSLLTIWDCNLYAFNFWTE